MSALSTVSVFTHKGWFQFVVLPDMARASLVADRLNSIGVQAEAEPLTDEEAQSFVEWRGSNTGGLLFDLIELAGLRTDGATYPLSDGSAVHWAVP